MARMQLFIFYLSLGLVGVCEIEISHMGKTTEILIWCARKNISSMVDATFINFNPLKLSGFLHPYQLDKSLSSLRVVG